MKPKSAERKYDWLVAAELYRQTLNSQDYRLRGDFLTYFELEERIALCLVQSAFQSDQMSEFRSRLRGALKTYENSAIFLEDDGHWSLNSKDKRKALSFLMRAKGSLIIYWLSDNEEKEISDALLSDSIQLGEKSLKICEELGMAREAAKGYAHLVSCLLEQLVSTKPDRQFLVSLTEKGVHHCQKGIRIYQRFLVILLQTPTISELSVNYTMSALGLQLPQSI